MKPCLIFPFIIACASVKERTDPLQDLIDAEYPVKGWFAGYDSALDLSVPKELREELPCKDHRAFFKAMAIAESGLDRTQFYREPEAIGGMNSIGLLQLSLEDQKNYRIDCGWKVESDLTNPITNLRCGAIMLDLLRQKYSGKSIWEYGGKYWSVLRAKKFWPDSNQDGFTRFSNALKKTCPLP